MYIMVKVDLAASLCLLMVSLWIPSLPTSVYVLAVWGMALGMWSSAGWIFPLMCLYSSFLLEVKLGLLLSSIDPGHKEMLDRSATTLEVCGVFIQTWDFPSFLSTFLPDLLCLIFSCLAYMYPPSSPPHPNRFFTFLTLLLLYTAALYTCSWATLAYLLLAVLWNLHVVYASTPNNRLPYTALSILTCTHLVLTFTFRLAHNPVYISPSLGLVDEEDYWMLSLVTALFFLAEWRREEEKTQETLQETLISAQEKQGEMTVLAWFYLHARSSELMIGVVRVLVVFWAERYREYISVLPLLWLFWSILVYSNRPVIVNLVNWLLVPSIVVGIFTHFIGNILPSAHLSPRLDFFLQLSFLLFLLLLAHKLQSNRRPFPPKTDSFKAILNEAICNFHKVSLTLLFIVGLSRIDLLHTPLLILCVYFWVDAEAAKRYWSFLLGYTMLVLMFLYVWSLTLDSGVHLDIGLLRVIGLQETGKTGANWTWPEEHWLWGLLLIESLQKVCFEHLQDYTRYELSRTNLLLSCLLRVKSMVLLFESQFEIWVLYSVMLCTIWLSDLNILNFFRYLLLIIFFATHFTDTSMRRGQSKVRFYWFIIKYYSGLILVFRYVFQFSGLTGTLEAERDLKLLGVELYNLEELYKAMVGDLILFVSSVFASKALAHKSAEPLITAHRLMFSESFAVLAPLGIGMVAVYWRLAGSMLLNLVVIIVYFAVSVSHHSRSIISAFTSKTVHPHSAFSLSLRSFTWRVLFFFCVLSLVTDYIVFVLQPEYMLQAEFDYTAWIMYAAGFCIVGKTDSLLSETLGYALILCILIVEKHCLELTQQARLEGQTVQYQLTADFQVWNHARVLLEEVLLMGVLLLAFYKLTVISIVYVFVLFCLCICSKDNLTILRVFAYILSFSILLQYAVLLSNVSSAVSTAPYPQISAQPFLVPWYPIIPWRDPARDPVFYNLGTSLFQVHSLCLDFLLLTGLLLYFRYFASHRPEVALPDPLASPSSLDSQSVWVSLKNIFYVTAHILILLLVLLFVSQSSGLSGLVYCSLCLLLLVEANTLLNFSRQWERHITLVTRFFLPILMLDLLALMVYQMPVVRDFSGKSSDMQRALGLGSLWEGDNGEEERYRQYRWVVFKALSFMVLRLLREMYSNPDFSNYIKEYRSQIQFEAEKIRERDKLGLETSREAEFKLQSQQKFDISRTLKDLLEIVHAWNEQKCDIQTSSEKIQQCLSKPEDVGMMWEQRVLLTLTNWVNGSFFHDFLEELKQPLPGQFVLPGPILYPSCKRYFTLLWYVICSRTQELCYLVFFLNHYYYASLESVVFPLSLLW